MRDGKRGEKNTDQHKAFLKEIKLDSAEHKSWIKWFWDMPLWIEEPNVQIVHACWSPEHLEVLRPKLKSNNRLTEEVLVEASRKGSGLHNSIETVLKGAEVKLPVGYSFKDHEKNIRKEIRTRWWNPDLTTFRSAYIGPPGVDIPDMPIPDYQGLPRPDRATFIGHYWFNGPIEPASEQVACLDYGVTNDGPLVSYRFDGERELSKNKFVAV